MGWIEGKPTTVSGSDGASDKNLVSYAPLSGEKLGESRIAGSAEIAQAFERARSAQASWAALPVERRCDLVKNLRDEIIRRAEEILDILAKECGKPRVEAL